MGLEHVRFVRFCAKDRIEGLQQAKQLAPGRLAPLAWEGTEMKFRFKKIGPIDEAELELGDLTIIAGRNNTGKTYIVYSLYGFMSNITSLLKGDAVTRFLQGHFAEVASLSTEEVVSQLIAEKRFSWNLESDFLARARASLIKELTREYSENGLYRAFNTSKDQFSEACLELDLSNVPGLSDLLGVPRRIHVSTPSGIEMSIGYEGTKFTAGLEDSKTKKDPAFLVEIVREALEYGYSQFLLGGLSRPKELPFILSSARHSIPLFINELDYVRSQVVLRLQQREEMQESEAPEGGDPLRSTSRYAAPIHDNIDFVRSVPEQVEAYTNRLRNVLPVDIEKMMGGAFESQNGAFRFTSIADSILDFDIPLHLASSSAWEMSNLYFYLGYFTERWSSRFLIIDEPESHLDTANQVQFARFLARLVESGVRVLITTHSDYIVKEINSLIMLNADFNGREGIMERFGYDVSLPPEDVRAYVAENGGLTRCQIDRYGIDMPVFDETIDEINSRANELASLLAIQEDS